MDLFFIFFLKKGRKNFRKNKTQHKQINIRNVIKIRNNFIRINNISMA